LVHSGNSFSLVESVNDNMNDLMVDAQCYYPFKLRSEIASLSHVDRLRIQGEASRLVARLAWLTAWVGFQRAIHAGEPVAQDLQSTLDDELRHTLMGPPFAPGLWMPARLISLLDRSRSVLLSIRDVDDEASHATS